MTSDKRRRATKVLTEHVEFADAFSCHINAMLAYAAEVEAAAIARCEAVCIALAKGAHQIDDAAKYECADAISKLKDAP